MSTVKDIETKYDDTSGTVGKFYAAELNLITGSISNSLKIYPEFDDENEKAFTKSMRIYSSEEVFNATGGDNLVLSSLESNYLDYFKLETLSGKIFSFKTDSNNTGPVTVTIGEVTKDLLTFKGDVLEPNDLNTESIFRLMFNSDLDAFVLLDKLTKEFKDLKTIIVSSDYDLVSGNNVVALTDSNDDNEEYIYTLTLPENPDANSFIFIQDGSGNASNAPIKIARSDVNSTIDNNSEDLICDVDYFWISLTFNKDSNNWSIGGK